MELVNFLLC